MWPLAGVFANVLICATFALEKKTPVNDGGVKSSVHLLLFTFDLAALGLAPRAGCLPGVRLGTRGGQLVLRGSSAGVDHFALLGRICMYVSHHVLTSLLIVFFTRGANTILYEYMNMLHTNKLFSIV